MDDTLARAVEHSVSECRHFPLRLTSDWMRSITRTSPQEVFETAKWLQQSGEYDATIHGNRNEFFLEIHGSGKPYSRDILHDILMRCVENNSPSDSICLSTSMIMHELKRQCRYPATSLKYEADTALAGTLWRSACGKKDQLWLTRTPRLITPGEIASQTHPRHYDAAMITVALNAILALQSNGYPISIDFSNVYDLVSAQCSSAMPGRIRDDVQRVVGEQFDFTTSGSRISIQGPRSGPTPMLELMLAKRPGALRDHIVQTLRVYKGMAPEAPCRCAASAETLAVLVAAKIAEAPGASVVYHGSTPRACHEFAALVSGCLVAASCISQDVRVETEHNANGVMLSFVDKESAASVLKCVVGYDVADPRVAMHVFDCVVAMDVYPPSSIVVA